MQVRGALETLVSALTTIDHVKGPTNEVEPALMNTDLLSRESESISLSTKLAGENSLYGYETYFIVCYCGPLL